MSVCLFTPEHDLCLAHDSDHYMAPASALQFADDCADIMRCIYDDEAVCYSARQYAEVCRMQASESTVPLHAWGWTRTLVATLHDAGVPAESLPTAVQLTAWRQLQHRNTAAQLLRWITGQNGAPYPVLAVTSMEQLALWRSTQGAVVLKAPWSGSGRGLRWLRDGEAPDEQTRAWLQKIVSQQGCVMAEPWLPVLQDFAMELYIGALPQELQQGRTSAGDEVTFLGYSLFSNRAGVYAGNLLLSDDEIERRLGEYLPIKQLHHIRFLLTHWLTQNLAPHYQGPLGIDMFVHDSPRGPRLRPVSEINLRHTMGLAAHEYLRRNPEEHGKHFAIQHDTVRQPAYRLQID